ncbi:ubiquitin-like modifier-activating enzyme atg7 [Anaeramoeba flamelloides]|uniref:Ubiquitin-like modifier-activating enzyme ATG7 n=1 Tax=Anaeramoeba flamelloides TaxID=1746091 RepID=A0AAV7ZGP6_9EUKA|nr:ubiquitin-like modifier-activating enzyme atg7 [Anaeramoeba flamelloides]
MSQIVKFQNLSSFVEPSYWYKLTKFKLGEWKLDDSPKPMTGIYKTGYTKGLPSQIIISGDSLNENTKEPLPLTYRVNGTLYNSNTLTQFKKMDRKAIFKSTVEKIWKNIASGEAIKNPDLLSEFFSTSFANLKKYIFYYWFSFPALILKASNGSQVTYAKPSASLSTVLNETQMGKLREEQTKRKASSFIVIIDKEGNLATAPLADFEKLYVETENVEEKPQMFVAFTDPSSHSKAPSWLIRNLFVNLIVNFPQLSGKNLPMIAYREDPVKQSLEPSLCFTVKFPVIDNIEQLISSDKCPFKATGWEKDKKGKLRPRVVDLSASMSPNKLAESSVDLNLQLMRWRVIPSLDLEKMKSTKCLLFGAGTLGCAVSRALLAWGFRHITLIDNGNVSFSNPVRQWLYDFEDCLEGGKKKATTAAAKLKKIFPSAITKGEVLTIPMPGHPAPEKALPEIEKAITRIEELVDEHDVIFLLTDSRESRWLPTVICGAKGKPILNLALGFDGYVVIRHGLPVKKMEKEPEHVIERRKQKKIVTDEDLWEFDPIGKMSHGCYFCNDIIAPTDSLTDRSLDMQCTVTKPACSPLCAAQAVEILVNILHHPLGWYAKADTKKTSHSRQSKLGLCPHTIRGFISNFDSMLIDGKSFEKCTACSEIVRKAYLEKGFEFLKLVFNDPQYLEKLTGLDLLQKQTLELIEDWDIDEDEKTEKKEINKDDDLDDFTFI